MNLICFFCLCCFSSDPEIEEEGLLVQELLLGETAEVQEPGEWQLTLAPSLIKGGDRRWPVSLEYGLSNRWELALAVAYEDEDGTREWGSPELEVGYALVSEGPWLVKAELGAGHPWDADEASSWTWEAGMAVSRALRWGEFHGGINGEEEVETEEREIETNLGAVFPLAKWRGLLEVRYTWEEDDQAASMGPALAYADGGLEFILGVVLGLNDAAEDHQWRLALTYEWD